MRVNHGAGERGCEGAGCPARTQTWCLTTAARRCCFVPKRDDAPGEGRYGAAAEPVRMEPYPGAVRRIDRSRPHGAGAPARGGGRLHWRAVAGVARCVAHFGDIGRRGAVVVRNRPVPGVPLARSEEHTSEI